MTAGIQSPMYVKTESRSGRKLVVHGTQQIKGIVRVVLGKVAPHSDG